MPDMGWAVVKTGLRERGPANDIKMVTEGGVRMMSERMGG